MVYVIAVGKRLPGWSGPKQEGGQFQIDSDGPTLNLYYNRPVQSEISAFRKGAIQVGLVKAGAHTLFFIFSIDGVTAGFSDCSFALGLVHPDSRNIDIRAPDHGWLCKMLLIDAQTGVVCAMRAATFTPLFSQILDELVLEQRSVLDRFAVQLHEQEIIVAHKRWPFPNDMVRDAIIIEKAGKAFF